MNRAGWPWHLVALVGLQTLAAIVFVLDLVLTMVPGAPIPWEIHELIQIGAGLGLVLGVVGGLLVLQDARRRTHRAESALKLASGAFMELVETRFGEWGLTPSERDVAMFALKGLNISEIAELRGTSDGTVKAQSSAVYRKADVTGRGQFVSLFVDELLDGPVVPAGASRSGRRDPERIH